jgi:hypothetical protein
LFSIQIQITWSYDGGALPGRPHGPGQATSEVEVVAVVLVSGDESAAVVAAVLRVDDAGAVEE